MRAMLVLCLVCLPSVAEAQDDPCADVSCSGLGECFEENGAPHCLCDPGHAELGLGCVAFDGEERAMRARHAPGAAQRVLATARREIGRKRWQVGDDRVAFPGPLSDYLAPLEWWCGDFVSWVYAGAGVPFTGGSAGGWLITDNRAIAAWFARRGDFIDRHHPEWDSYTPRPGDFVRFRTDRYGHAAIVERVRGETLWLIEGNVSNEVVRQSYRRWRRNRRIDGIGRVTLDNGVPVVDAGPDRTVRLGEWVAVGAAVVDDGPVHALTSHWTVPDAAELEDTHAPVTRARFSSPGTYELALLADDGEHTGVDRVSVRVVEPPPDPAPESEGEDTQPPESTQAGWRCVAAPSSAPGSEAWLLLGLLALARRRS